MSVVEYISKKEIDKAVSRLAKKITSDYNDEELVIIGILNGSFIFCADLVRKIQLPLIVEFLAASSYGDNTTSSGKVDITYDLKKNIYDKHVLIVEDLIDTGHTIKYLQEYLKCRRPKSLKVATLLTKPARRVHNLKIDYIGLEIEDRFVIGYGLDFAGKYRELPFIGVYQEDADETPS
ncbi:MAG: hypoxanthine phosphoribosyltransferase [Bacteriovoracaceae bacterium]|nr:hypoxanthine phosphoribosyltransferase [Bacteriovoracaceae bacterium]